MGADCYMPLKPGAAGGDAPGNPRLSLNPARIGPAVRAGCSKTIPLVYICRASLFAHAWCPRYPLRLEAPTGLPGCGDGGGDGNGEGHGGMGRMRRRTGRSGAEAQRRSWPLMHAQWRARRSWRSGHGGHRGYRVHSWADMVQRAQRTQRIRVGTEGIQSMQGAEGTYGAVCTKSAQRAHRVHGGAGGHREGRGYREVFRF